MDLIKEAVRTGRAPADTPKWSPTVDKPVYQGLQRIFAFEKVSRSMGRKVSLLVQSMLEVSKLSKEIVEKYHAGS